MCMVDITHIPGAQAGDEVILIGGERGRHMVERMASLMGTIPYEILSCFGRRVRRIYCGEHYSGSRAESRIGAQRENT